MDAKHGFEWALRHTAAECVLVETQLQVSGLPILAENPACLRVSTDYAEADV